MRQVQNKNLAIGALAVVLAGCGGGGGGSLTPQGSSSGIMYTQGIYLPAAQFKGSCAVPRVGDSRDRLGTVLDEDLWLRSWTSELYLWYSEVPDINPTGYTAANYFPLLKTSAKTATGSAKDRFHFTQDTAQYEAFAQSGVQSGYGLDVEFPTMSRQHYIGFVEPGSPAALANIQRGAQIVTIDGTDFATGSAAALNAGLFPAKAGEMHTFVIRDLRAVTTTITMTSANVTGMPVQNVKTIATGSGTVGYLLFNDHIATAEGQLISAINTLKAAGVGDLVLDIRYNGGGYLDIAAEAAYMISGSNTAGHFFEKIQFNDKNPTVDPVTRQTLTPTPFYAKSLGFSAPSVPAGTTLPTLNLSKVYVLSGPGTCSASESIINGLRGAGVLVYEIGSTTCGKPYGFYAQDNCSTTYFSIEFRGINDAGFGDYPDGFSPQNSRTPTNASLPGCSIADDPSKALGDPAEGRLAAALAFRASGNVTCPAASGFAPDHVGIQSVRSDNDVGDPLMTKSPLRENRWYR